MTPQQAAELAKLRADTAVAWLVIYEDGTSCVMRDDGRSAVHAGGAHAIRVGLAPMVAAAGAGEAASG